jgi:hypothetical protein
VNSNASFEAVVQNCIGAAANSFSHSRLPSKGHLEIFSATLDTPTGDSLVRHSGLVFDPNQRRYYLTEQCPVNYFVTTEVSLWPRKIQVASNIAAIPYFLSNNRPGWHVQIFPGHGLLPTRPGTVSGITKRIRSPRRIPRPTIIC